MNGTPYGVYWPYRLRSLSFMNAISSIWSNAFVQFTWIHFVEFHPHEQLHPCSQFQPSSTCLQSNPCMSIYPCHQFHPCFLASSLVVNFIIEIHFHLHNVFHPSIHIYTICMTWNKINYIQTHIHLLSSLVANLHMWWYISFMYDTSHLYSRFH
jgi:hypothetical protein